jgi:hypothetical protein
MTDSEEAPKEAPRRRPFYKRIRQKDSWLRHRHDPTKAEVKEWEDAGMPAHLEIVAGFLASNNFVYGVPDKSEIFRLHDLAREDEQAMFASDNWTRDMLNLHYVQPSPIPTVYYTLAHPPIGVGFGDIVEVNYNVRLQGIISEMHLCNIRVESGNRDGEDPTMVFLGTEYLGPAMRRQIRVVRITVNIPGYGTWETVSETVYPKSVF